MTPPAAHFGRFARGCFSIGTMRGQKLRSSWPNIVLPGVLGDAELVLTLHSDELPRAVARSNTARISIDAVLSPEVALQHQGQLTTTLAIIGVRTIEFPHPLIGTVRPSMRNDPQILKLRFASADLSAAMKSAR